MQVKLWKDYKILFLIIFGFFCFFININTANALVYKDSVYAPSTVTSGNTSGTLNFNARNEVKYNLEGYTFSNQYDYLVFKFGTYRVESFDQMGSWCMAWLPSGNGYVCGSYNSENGKSYGANSDYVYVSVNLQYNVNGTAALYSPCSLHTELNNENYWVCSLSKNYASPSYFNFEIKNSQHERVYYNLSLNGTKFYYNNDSTEMLNAINNISTTTNQNIQVIQQQNTQQQQYLENNDTTGTQQQVSTDIASTSSELSTASNSVNDLTNIIMAPLTLFMDLSTSSCAPIHLVVPFVNTSFDLPCMSTIYNAYFSTFLTIFATVISSITCYWISIKTIKLIKELLDCDNDRIEVLDL